MATTTTAFLSTANSFLSCSPPSSSSSSCLCSVIYYPQKYNSKRQLICCRASSSSDSQPILTKRSLSICFFTSYVFSLANSGANAAILEADENDELMEKVKRDRKKRIERQGVINSSNKEKGYLQDLIYKLSKVGQAIENNDLPAANSVLGGNTDTDWVHKANLAFSKLSSGPEETNEVDAFNSSLASLISSVTRNDIESSKIAFVSSATAFEKWTNLTGLVAQLKGL
ncbi:thylakoid lumenal 16.5 kDa protein, chloroplastic [Euphorbia lathyris]|uniref:thylakoid lumenal 16.5 kDa protein, chloroplastic n=1 Tax=Euphorbia lathyris TaxID=212925 RepID=UPI003313C569